MRFFSKLSILFILITFSSSFNVEASCLPKSFENGVADLRCWDGQSEVSLTGKWLLEYQAFEEDVNYKGFAEVPGHWREFKPALPYLGRGIYRIKLLLAQPIENLAIQLKQTHMARKLIIIDERGMQKVIFDSGNTDRLLTSNIKMRMPILHLPRLGKISTLILHVNNTTSIHGGIEKAPLLGPSIALFRSEQVLKYSTMAIITVLVAFFAINLYMWWVRERSFAVLALALMAFIVSIRQLVVSGIIVTTHTLQL